MSGNVQMAEPPSGIEAWQRSLPWWDVYFGAVLIATVAFAFKPGAIALLAAMAVWYVALGRRAIHGDHLFRMGLIYLVGATILFVPAVVIASGASFALFALSPQAHMALGFRRGTVATVILNFIPTIVLYLRTGEVRHTLPIAILATVLTTIIGYSIDRLINQSIELAESRAEVAQLSQEAERQRLGADLHDTIAQGLSSVVMLIQAADAALDRDPGEARCHLDLAARTARENLQELRAVLDALMPTEQDLPEALRRLALRFTEETRVSATVRVEGDPRALPVALEVVLIRAAQESLSNVRQHARASAVAVVLTYEEESVGLEVVDDGCGFKPSETFGGYGLQAMRSRLTQVGGEFAVDPAHPGTAVRVAVPA
ncbi:MAG TPA: hypothetical protein DGG94_09585 [Micromonosporaceae bacterium]|nr:hypothetical protein [Micromonosporaceae bacterium]HCU50034.1 hypothetical protein [Micromonosporaceae bacterium]